MATKRILVTGATGFIGRQVLPLLLDKGYEVHGAHFRDAVPTLSQPCEFHDVNLLELSTIETLLSSLKPDYLLHLAWEARPGIYWTSPANLEWARASIALFREFYRQGGCRGVSAGTCAEYRWDNSGPCNEAITTLQPATLYGACKLGFAKMMEAYARQEGYSYSWGRVFFTFGPGEYPQRLVPMVIRALLQGEQAKTTDGLHLRDFIYVEDVARAFMALLESDCNGPANIGSGSGTSIADIVIKLGKMCGRSELIQLGALPAPKNEPASLVADVAILRKEVGFAPKYTIDQALMQTIAWWRKHL